MASSIRSDRFQKCPPALVQHEHLLGFQYHFCLSTMSYMQKICQTFHGYQAHPHPLQIRVFQKTPSWDRNWQIHSPQFQSEIYHALVFRIFGLNSWLDIKPWASSATAGSRAMQSHYQIGSAAWEVMPHQKLKTWEVIPIESPWHLWKQNENIKSQRLNFPCIWHHIDVKHHGNIFQHGFSLVWLLLSKWWVFSSMSSISYQKIKMAPPEDHLWTTSWRRPPYHQYLP